MPMIGRRGVAGRHGGLGGTVAMIALAGAAALAWYEAPSGAPPRAAIFEIVAVTYIAIAIGRLPGFRLDRAGAALVGASLMLAVGRSPRRSTSIRSSCCWGDDRRRQSAP